MATKADKERVEASYQMLAPGMELLAVAVRAGACCSLHACVLGTWLCVDLLEELLPDIPGREQFLKDLSSHIQLGIAELVGAKPDVTEH